jgi:hypothetical protein
MTTATPLQTYATEAEADLFLAIHLDWQDADTEIKTDALLWGRYFLDINFDCVIDMDIIDEEVKFANSLLAYDYFSQGDLFFDNQKVVRQKKVVAGKVETERTFFRSSKDGPDSFSKVVAILKTICNKTKGNLVRV